MDIKSLVNKAKEMEDHSEVQEGGNFDYTPPPEGKSVSRFVEYVELGKHPEFFEGKEKTHPVEYVRLGWELLGPKNIKEIDVEGGKKKVADYLSVTIPKKFTEKAKFMKLFMKMTAGRAEITHMAEMLGEAFIIDVGHNKSADGKQTYANVWYEKAKGEGAAWHISAPRIITPGDPLAGTPDTSVDISSKVPEHLRALRIFLWSNPTEECWDTLFIDGFNETKDDKGNVKKVSKNWLQEKILSAKDFGGSALEQMIAGLDDLPTTSEQSKTQTSESKQEESAPAGTQTAATAADTNTADTSAADLAALGL